MNICIIGTGYVGLVSGACMAELGHAVTCIDIDERKVQKLHEGSMPIYEEGLEDLVRRNYSAGRLSFSTNLSEGMSEAEVVINAVGTPPDNNRRVDLKYVKQVAKEIGQNLDHYVVVVNKSTVPVGTARMVKQIITENLKTQTEFDVASNPEFLREGAAIKDFMNPDKIVIGTDSDRAKEILERLYKPLTDQGFTLVSTNIPSAELIKYANNSFLVTKITFINEIANLCEEIGADVLEVARAIGLDSRVGPKFLEPGPGYGGSCFPKDADALTNIATDYGVTLRVVEAVIEANRVQRLIAVGKLKKYFDSLAGKTIAVWGLAFKPGTDDVREAASIELLKTFQLEGVKSRVYDPMAMENTKNEVNGNGIHYASDMWDALWGADALVVMTHWDEFKRVDPLEVIEKMSGNVVIDARNIWSSEPFIENGFIYEGVGRS